MPCLQGSCLKMSVGDLIFALRNPTGTRVPHWKFKPKRQHPHFHAQMACTCCHQPNIWHIQETNREASHLQDANLEHFHRSPHVQDMTLPGHTRDCNQAMCSSNRRNLRFCHSDNLCNWNRVVWLL